MAGCLIPDPCVVLLPLPRSPLNPEPQTPITGRCGVPVRYHPTPSGYAVGRAAPSRSLARDAKPPLDLPLVLLFLVGHPPGNLIVPRRRR